MNAPAFKIIWDRAVAAGMAAGRGCVPDPMCVVDSNIFGKPIPGAKVSVIDDGPCGFAWVNVKPGNSAFANWLKANKLARKDYNGGVSVWVSEFGQSMSRKEDYAYAFAKVLQESGVKAYASSRMD